MSIMNQLNNYFKNGALILVVVMLITIPNLHVYSSIGSYQIVSSAITANKKNNTDITKKETEATITVIQQLAEITGRAALPNYVVLLSLQARGLLGHGKLFCPKKHNTKTYAKYDFSGFDN